MLENLFYIVGLVVILSVLNIISKFKSIYSVREWEQKYKKVVGKIPVRSDYRSKSEYNLSRKMGILYLFEIIWVIIGILTYNWYLFLGLIIFSFISGMILKPFRYTLVFKILSVLFLIIRLVLYTYLVINHFHLHIDTYEVILQHFNSL